MNEIKTNIALKPYNSFGLEVFAAYFSEVGSVDDVLYLLNRDGINQVPWLILGGGSNILFTEDFKGLVLKNNIQGISIEAESDDDICIKAGSGVIWHDLVIYCIQNNYGGVENLSLIPGTVGAAPIQNIGAYGSELKDVFDSLVALDLEDGKELTFWKDTCRFGYRDSIFKQEARDRFFILSVTLKLKKHPVTNTSYGAIQKVLEERGIQNPGVNDVSEAVCTIRQSKLPDPAKIGNAGSFFKNPEITKEQFETLHQLYPDMPGYITEHGIKVPAGWLIETCGWKGKRVGNTGSHKDQALVLVNYGQATGLEVKELAEDIQESVAEKFGIRIETEVNII